MEKQHSPKILSTGWGKMEVETFGSGRDFKLWPGGCCAWNWQETGTSHRDGVQIADLDDLISRGCEVIVIGTGVFSRLRISQKTRSFIKEQKIKVHIAGTKKAVRIYNKNVESGNRTGGLFHTTC